MARFDRGPRLSWKEHGVYLAVAAAVLIQFRAPLLGKVYWFEDIQAYFQPLWTAAGRAMRHGSLPSWDLGAWSGQPLTGDPQIGLFYPPNWIWLWVAPLRAYAWLALFHAALAATGMAALVRARGRSHQAAALAGLGLGLSAFMVLELRHAMFGASTAWLVWVLWGIEKYSHERRLDRLAVAAFAFGLAILAGGWSMLYWGALVVAVYALRSPRVAIAAAAIGVALAAVQLFPAIAHGRFSPRALGLEYSEASSYAWPSFRYLITLVFPTWYGDDARGTYVGAPDQWELCGYAVGAITLLLALLSLFRRDRRRERIALVALCLFAVVIARGGGLHRFLFDHLPFFGSMRCPARALYICTLVLPLLGADGLDWLFDERPRLRTLVVALLALELLWTWRAENPSVTLAETQSRPPAIDWIKANARSGRSVNDVNLGQRWHNFGLLYSMESAGGYSSLPIWRYLHFLWIANHGAVYPHAQLANDLTAQGLWRFSSPLVDLLGVSHLMTTKPPEGAGWRRVFTGPDGIDVWKNDQAFPRGFVVYETRVAPDEGEQAQALTTLDPAKEAIVDRELGVHGGGPASPIFALYRDSPFDLIVEVTAQKKGVLVFGEVWAPGWKVMVDGRPVELLRVDYALRGVVLEPGTHTVAMMLEDDPLAYGAALSLTALSLIIGLEALARRRTRLTSANKP